MKFLNKIIFFYYREYKLNLSGFQDILTNITFFFISILVFIFSIGPNKEIISQVGVGIVWTLLLLSSTLSLRKFYQDASSANKSAEILQRSIRKKYSWEEIAKKYERKFGEMF